MGGFFFLKKNIFKNSTVLFGSFFLIFSFDRISFFVTPAYQVIIKLIRDKTENKSHQDKWYRNTIQTDTSGFHGSPFVSFYHKADTEYGCNEGCHRESDIYKPGECKKIIFENDTYRDCIINETV